MSLLFEVVRGIEKKIDKMPSLAAAMQRLQNGCFPDSIEGEICKLYLDLEELSKKVQ